MVLRNGSITGEVLSTLESPQTTIIATFFPSRMALDASFATVVVLPTPVGPMSIFMFLLSDAFAGLVGGLGFAASGNIGDEVAVFEPTHGSAPKYAELDPPIVNPIAMILTGAMLLDHVGETERAGRVRDAVAAVVREGKVRSYDMMKLTGGPDVIAKGAASTPQITDAIIERL